VKDNCQFFTWADDLQDAKEKLETHEAECHFCKQVGSFGKTSVIPAHGILSDLINKNLDLNTNK
jgi:hypothetical protein